MRKSAVVFLFIIFSFVAHSYEINQINIIGNKLVLKMVIELSIPYKVGDVIGTTEEEVEKVVNEVQEAVLGIGYFGNAAVRIVPVSREKANLNIQVLEFPLINEIVFEGEELVEKQVVLDTMKTKVDEVLNINFFKEDLVNLRKLYYEKGIMLGQKSSIKLSDNFDKVIIRIFRAKIKDYTIEGNTKTRDNVIERELEFDKGSYYDFVALRRSYQNLANTGYFKSLDFVPETDAEGDVNIKVKVEEEETGQFKFGGTYGSENGLSGLIEVVDKNFKGRGLQLNLKAEFGGRDIYELGYVNPRFHDKKISHSINLYKTKYDRDQYLNGVYQSTYEERRTGYNMAWGKNHTLFTRFGAAFYDEDITIEPKTTTIADDHVQTLRLNVSKDIRDNIQYPKFGYYSYSSIEFIGGFLKGNDDFTRYNTTFKYFKELNDKFILATQLKYGKIDLRKGSVEEYEQFALGGGSSVRGYESREFTGNEMILSNLEFRYSINETLKCYVFMDKGNLDFDSSTGSGEKTGIGFGIQLKTPIGMIRLDWGKPDESGRGTKNYFNFGNMF